MDTYWIKTESGYGLDTNFYSRTKVSVQARFNNRFSVVRNRCVQELLNESLDIQLKDIPKRETTLIGGFYPSFDSIDANLVEQFMWERRKKLVNVRPVMLDGKDIMINEDNMELWNPEVPYKKVYARRTKRDYGAAMGIYAEERLTNAYDIMGIIEKDFPPRATHEQLNHFTIEARLTTI